MDRNNVICVGWGSTTKRPHWWVSVFGNSPKCDLESDGQTMVVDRKHRHDGVDDRKDLYHQHHHQVAWQDATTGRSSAESVVKSTNQRCRSLTGEDHFRCGLRDDRWHHHADSGYIVSGLTDRADVYRYQTDDDDDNGNSTLFGGKREINSNLYPEERNHLDTSRSNTASRYGGEAAASQCDDRGLASPDHHHHQNQRNKYPDNQHHHHHHHLDYNTNQLDWSPEKVSSSGSSFDSGYHSTYNGSTAPRDLVGGRGGGSSRIGTGDLCHGSDREPLSPPSPPSTSGQKSFPVQRTQHAPYQLSQEFASYQGGIKRTLDKCEDRCVKVIHPSLIWAEQPSEWESIIMIKYIGSFSVIGEDQTARAEYVRKQLQEMRNVTKTKPVLLVISLSGIKVCSSTGESVYMAHALKRISYATCDPDCCQFSFLAREPKGHTNIQYCHAFVTKTALEAEELNAIVGNAFKMAFTYQRERQQQQQQQQQLQQQQQQPQQQQSTPELISSPPMTQRQPTFHELIEQQIEEQREQNEQIQRRQQEELSKRLSEISTAKIDERIKELNERKRKEKEELEREQETQRLQRLQGKDRTSWAKHVAGRAKHKSPLRTPLQSGMGDPQSKHTSSPQSHRQTANTVNQTTSTSTGTSTSATNDGQSEAPCSASASVQSNVGKQSPFTSISALREAFNAGELRSYGSPVMTLKETIDKIPWSGDFTSSAAADAFRRSQASNSNDQFVDYGQTEPESPEPGPSYQRPLPATPPEIQRPKAKGQRPANQKSPPLADDHSKLQSNGHLPTAASRRSRPLSGKYQNDSPMHGRCVETDDSGDMYQGPPTPLRYDSLRKIDRSDAPIEEDLKNAPWYQAGIPREIALEMLSQEEVGSFVVRDSTTHPGCYALSVKVPKFDNPAGISHYLITRTAHGGVKLKGLDKEWSSLTALVTHHSVMRELLPCPLRLPRIANNPAFNDEEKTCEQEDDDDYQRLADFSHMMQDLKM